MSCLSSPFQEEEDEEGGAGGGGGGGCIHSGEVVSPHKQAATFLQFDAPHAVRVLVWRGYPCSPKPSEVTRPLFLFEVVSALLPAAPYDTLKTCFGGGSAPKLTNQVRKPRLDEQRANMTIQ